MVNNEKELQIAKTKLEEEWKKYKMDKTGLKKEMVSDDLLSFCVKKGSDKREIEMSVILLVRQLINMHMTGNIPQDLNAYKQEVVLKYSDEVKVYF